MFIPRNQLCGIVHSGIHARVASTAVTTRHATITCLRQTPSSFHTSSGPRSSIPTSQYNPFISSNTPRHRIPGARGIITGTYPSTPLNKYNHKLITLLRDPQTCLPIFDKCREIQELNLKPDLTTYTVLLEAHERNNDLESIMKTLEEMELVGISPSISAFNIALRVCSFASALKSEGSTYSCIKRTCLLTFGMKTIACCFRLQDQTEILSCWRRLQSLFARQDCR